MVLIILRKFATNCRDLQGLIDAEEHGISVSEMPTGTFAQYTLDRGVTSLKSGQQKVLGSFGAWTRMR